MCRHPAPTRHQLEQPSGPASLFRWVILAVGFIGAFSILKFLVGVMVSAVYYVVIGVAAAAIALTVVKRIES